MFLRHIYDEKLAQASYFVACPATGDALVIDPARDITPYTQIAAAQGFTITAVAETHIHADFVSGARQLAHTVGATLLVSGEGGENWQYTYLEDYPHARLTDGDTFEVGTLTFSVLHTPGHTPEHLSFLLRAEGDYAIFTGDFVFVGDVGRPDLLERAANEAGTSEVMARAMFQSLSRFRDLPDHLLVLPGHGAGSACGKSLGAVPSSTVGYEKLYNTMLRYTGENAFVAALLHGQTTPPAYFGHMKRINRDGPKILTDIDRPDKLPPIVLRDALEKGTLILDTRPRDDYAAYHLPGTLNIEHGNALPNWAGSLISYDAPFYAITNDPHTLIRDLGSVGLDNLAGTFPTSTFSTIERTTAVEFLSYEHRTPASLANDLRAGGAVLDVRTPNEYAEGHINGALNIPLGDLPRRLDDLPTARPLIVYCQTGIRSAIAVSLLRRAGFDVVNLSGGYAAWQAASQPIS